jgi:hypothetical protein
MQMLNSILEAFDRNCNKFKIVEEENDYLREEISSVGRRNLELVHTNKNLAVQVRKLLNHQQPIVDLSS